MHKNIEYFSRERVTRFSFGNFTTLFYLIPWEGREGEVESGPLDSRPLLYLHMLHVNKA